MTNQPMPWANPKTAFYGLTVRGAGGDDHVCLVDLDGQVFRFRR